MDLVFRPRRLRRSETLRKMVRETVLRREDLIYPMFVAPGQGVRQPVDSMPGVWRFSVDQLLKEAREIKDLGLPAVLLFGLPVKKDETGSEAASPKGAVQQAVRRLKKEAPELLVITDVCMCAYTCHGHCGLIHEGEVDNDASLEALAQVAVSHAEAGADMVAPFGYDGRPGRRHPGGPGRTGLRDGAHHVLRGEIRLQLLRALPGSRGFRPEFGDRRAYQMDPANAREALREAALDVEEGADILMVKPALPYLDIIAQLAAEFDLPLAAYQVSGEYSMIKAGAQLGWLDETAVMLESLTAIKRAGADLILTYFAKQAAALLK